MGVSSLPEKAKWVSREGRLVLKRTPASEQAAEKPAHLSNQEKSENQDGSNNQASLSLLHQEAEVSRISVQTAAKTKGIASVSAPHDPPKRIPVQNQGNKSSDVSAEDTAEQRAEQVLHFAGSQQAETNQEDDSSFSSEGAPAFVQEIHQLSGPNQERQKQTDNISLEDVGSQGRRRPGPAGRLEETGITGGLPGINKNI